MARVQATYQGAPVGVERTNAPQQQTTLVAANDSAGRLAQSLGIFQSAGFQNMVDQRVQQVHQDAISWSNQTSMADLKAAVENGKMYPSESPVFAAAAQNIYGSRAFGEMVADTKSRLETGELSFQDTKAFDQYFQGKRAEILKNASNFTVKGFDKNYAEVQASLGEYVRKSNDKARIEDAMAQGSAAIQQQVAYVTDPKSFKGTPQDASTILVGTYNTLIKNGVVPREKGKELLANSVQALVPAGQSGLLKSLLDTQVSDGLRVRDIVGEPHANLWAVQADNQQRTIQTQNWKDETKDFVLQADKGQLVGKSLKAFEAVWERYKPYLPAESFLHVTNMQDAAIKRIQTQTSTELFNGLVASQTAANQASVAANLEAGTFGTWLPGANLKMPKKDGGTSDWSNEAKDAAWTYLNEKHAQSDPVTRAYDFARNQVEDRQLKADMTKLSNTMSEVAVSTDGKPIQQLDPSVGPQLAMFRQLRDTNAEYLKKTVGSQDVYQRLEMASDMVAMGRSPEEVANGLSRMDRIKPGTEDFKKVNESIQRGVSELTDPGMFHKLMQKLPFNEVYADVSNMGTYSAYVRKWATFNMVTGISGTATEAVQSAVAQLSKNTTRVNNAVYLNSDLPQFPKDIGGTPGQWMESFISKVITPVVKDQGYDASKVRLEPGQGGYMVYINGDTPLNHKDNPQYPVMIPKETIVAFAQNAHNTGIADLAANNAFQADYGRFQKYLNAEENRLAKTMGTYTLERLYPGPGLPQYARGHLIDNPKDFKWLQDNGFDKLPLPDMLQKLKEKRTKK